MALLDAYNATVGAAKLVKPGTDDAVVEAGRTIAHQIDYAIENLEGQDVTKALYLTPHLMNVLKELLATPKSRLDAGIKDEAGGEDPLEAELANVKQLRVV